MAENSSEGASSGQMDEKSKITSSEWEDSGITMLDVLEEEKELEEDADAVLGAADDKNCTYLQGYISRQALYACLTCVTPADPPAGICLACSYHCHENHELVELYTKRNFKCDCGNSKFPKNACKLEPKKESENVDNKYNQNFRGMYCTCAKPYPDANDSVPDEMIQCVICEDWYHGRHLGSTLPDQADYSEMICGTCVKSRPFLLHYLGYAVTKVAKTESKEEVNVLDSSIKESNTKEGCGDADGGERKDKEGTSKNDADKADKAQVPSECSMPTTPLEEKGGAVFWPEGWRKLLCRCQSCQDLYTKEKVGYLLESTDTVSNYEESGKTKKEKVGSQYDQGMAALSSLGRMEQVEALHGYNTLKEELVGFLGQFARNKRLVKEEDIRGFFQDLESRKRQKVDKPVSIPHFCR